MYTHAAVRTKYGHTATVYIPRRMYSVLYRINGFISTFSRAPSRCFVATAVVPRLVNQGVFMTNATQNFQAWIFERLSLVLMHPLAV